MQIVKNGLVQIVPIFCFELEQVRKIIQVLLYSHLSMGREPAVPG